MKHVTCEYQRNMLLVIVNETFYMGVLMKDVNYDAIRNLLLFMLVEIISVMWY